MTSVYKTQNESSNISRVRDDVVLCLTDKYDQTLTIKVCSVAPSHDELDAYDCVCMSARYDHGFGFSQLYRFVDDKQSMKIKQICDLANESNRSQLLPMSSSARWWAIVTPIVKGNGHIQKITCRSIMTDIIQLTRVPSVCASKIFISQYRYMCAYRARQLQGVFEAIKQLQIGGFKGTEVICFEVDGRFKRQFEAHLMDVLSLHSKK